ncbi:hypothetical protein KSP39_PZI010024 [Platanthera zijinensis]|uniref:Kinesin light chain n=1 Tax=Platanthera zijinensis TaxID=2320716 RepID=A0AAP0G6L3_9ASPA
MRILPSTGILSSLRLLCLEKSIPLADCPWQGFIGVQRSDPFLSSRNKNSWHVILKILLFGSTAISLGLSRNIVLADDASASSLTINNNPGDNYVTGLRKIEDGSIISNSHTIKWRIFTDNGKDLFQKGKLDEAEKYFQSALQEAKIGFGPRDSHVASACNNLAEIYRARRTFDKAEPLYLEAINILEESFGIDDIRVGATLHNLGQFYFLQRKFEQAQKYYERALKIEGRVLGYGHTDYANTMYHLGMALYLQGKEKDSEALLQESIRILEENGLGETITCVRRMRYLTQMLLKSERLAEAENLQRKILHILEISKGWNLPETLSAAEGLAMILQSLERFEEAQELLERCLDARKNILPHDDIQVAANMLHLGRLALLKYNHLRKLEVCDAGRQLDEAKLLVDNSIRIAKGNVSHAVGSQQGLQGSRIAEESAKNRKFALIILVQSLDFLRLLITTKSEIPERKSDLSIFRVEVERALHECISIFQESAASRNLLLNSEDAKKEYVSCLDHLMNCQLGESKSFEKLKADAQRIKEELSSFS